MLLGRIRGSVRRVGRIAGVALAGSKRRDGDEALVSVVSARERDVADRCCSCLRLVIRSQSRQSRRTVPTQRSANAFACGGRNGVRMISTLSLRKTSSKPRMNLLSRSWIRKRAGVARLESDQASCRACWVVQRPSGLAVPREVHAPAAELEEEEHIEAAEPERVDREEITGDNRLGVSAQELAPAKLGASAGRGHPVKGVKTAFSLRLRLCSTRAGGRRGDLGGG